VLQSIGRSTVLLPRKYEGSFFSQDVSIQRRQLILLSWALGLVKDSLPARAELIAFCKQSGAGCEVINLSTELASDLKNGLAKVGGNKPLDDRLTKGVIHPQGGQFYACALSYRQQPGNLSAPDSAASYQTAAWSVQWEDRLLQELVQAGNKADRDPGERSWNSRSGPDSELGV
jgi:hypothetical protein